MKNWLKRYAFLLLLAAVLVGGETVLNLTDPVSRMTCIWRNDYELIRLQHPDMTFEKAIFGSSAVTASYIEGREGSVGYANIGMDYGTVKDITEMLEKGELTVTEDLVLGLNNLSFLDTLPTNATYPWHRKWYEPYLYFQRDRLEQLVTDGVTNLLNGEPFTKVDSSHQQRAVYRGALSDEDLMESWESLVERFGETTPEVDCAENFAALDRLAAWCEDHGVRLRAIWMPWNGKLEIYPAAQNVMDYANQQLERLGIETLDMTRVVEDQYFFDTGHLDYDTGAPWFTDYIDPWLAEED
ncbi:hypothetical protein [Intestinimonas massiliensis (ex Afouda et al. 2020)]|uniref:hypothetical protein n=1 Tax=Intestinimonas massiliensis (ex Afouda et al. 2020) TaxID=1673721 RepID=UPI0010321218|nr:hypothetical protein [Intestinimonas massiliensis (ex Afouda et al. 2020)]